MKSIALVILSAWAYTTLAQSPPSDRGQALLDSYFTQRVASIRSTGLQRYQRLSDWQTDRPERQRRLREMLGLDPWPERTPLSPKIVDRIEESDITVEKLHFQSVPGLYVTANFYLPKHVEGPLPTILYVCGHALVKEGDRSFGNKVAYQHHGIWFAQNGYACLIIDTIHRGEIESIHHGTYSYDMWWWNSRGYTSAGIETWNSIRALDYLETRPEVDRDRIGITGRSGGGVYSWWTAAIDERIRVAVPVAGITDLKNHVVDGTVEGHCDCMFQVNTYGWDYPEVAALIAPRPLLIANTDKDSIFPLDGVVRVHQAVQSIYELYDQTDHLGLLITDGPHKDTQDLRVPTFRWFNRFLKNSQAAIQNPALKRFPNQALAVFDTLPKDAINRTVQETFVPAAPAPAVPTSAVTWAEQKQVWLKALAEKSFRSWPWGERGTEIRDGERKTIGSGTLHHFTVGVQRIPLSLFVFLPKEGSVIDGLRLHVPIESEWPEIQSALRSALTGPGDAPFFRDLDASKAHAWFPPRGIGPTAWSSDKRHVTHVRRRFMLLGETLDSMRVWDIIRGVRAIGSLAALKSLPITVTASDTMSVNALYASLFLPTVKSLELIDLPASHQAGPDYLNVLKIWDIPQALAVSLEHRSIHLITPAPRVANFANTTRERLGWRTTLTLE